LAAATLAATCPGLLSAATGSALAGSSGKAPPGVTVTRLVSKAALGIPANADSGTPQLSGDCTTVAFSSLASNLSAGDTNGVSDVYARLRGAKQTILASPGLGGDPADGASSAGGVSAEGRFVAFSSGASNLVSADTNGVEDVFVRDLMRSKTMRISVSSSGAEGNGDSVRPSISADGRFVTFTSRADNLVAGDTNASPDVFLRDRRAHMTTRVSLTSDGSETPPGSFIDEARISGNGRFVVFMTSEPLTSEDDNEGFDVYRYDQLADAVVMVTAGVPSIAGVSNAESPDISKNGRFVAFENTVFMVVDAHTIEHSDVFVRDMHSGSLTKLSKSSSDWSSSEVSRDPTISDDGTRIAYWSNFRQLRRDTNGAPDAFLFATSTGARRMVSLSSDGALGDAASFGPDISGNGWCVGFESLATTLVAGDDSAASDVILRRLAHRAR
jgi:Tol biopolymer transport system component